MFNKNFHFTYFDFNALLTLQHLRKFKEIKLIADIQVRVIQKRRWNIKDLIKKYINKSTVR